MIIMIMIINTSLGIPPGDHCQLLFGGVPYFHLPHPLLIWAREPGGPASFSCQVRYSNFPHRFSLTSPLLCLGFWLAFEEELLLKYPSQFYTRVLGFTKFFFFFLNRLKLFGNVHVETLSIFICLITWYQGEAKFSDSLGARVAPNLDSGQE